MFKNSIAKYADRGNYGDRRYRGNCTGHIINDFLDYAEANTQKLFCDPSVGGGTSADVARERNLPFAGYDLHSGFNLLKQDLGHQLDTDHGRRAQYIFWHPPYFNCIAYADTVWGQTPHPDDLSNCKNADEFFEKLQLALMNIYDGLNSGGYYGVLMGNYRKSGTYMALAAMMNQLMPGKLREEIIKEQINTKSEFKFYSPGPKWVPISHEILYIYQKDTKIFAMEHALDLTIQLKRIEANTWKNVVKRTLMQAGKALSLDEIYNRVRTCPLVVNNPNWQAKVRQKLQDASTFCRIDRGVYTLA